MRSKQSGNISTAMNWLQRYAHWLHGQWPAGSAEALPITAEDGRTAIPGVFIVGDRRGAGISVADPALLDLVIIGGGVSGMAAELEAKKRDLLYLIVEASEVFSTLVNFPKGKPIFTYPKDMIPAGDLHVYARFSRFAIGAEKKKCISCNVCTSVCHMGIDVMSFANKGLPMKDPHRCGGAHR